MGVDIEVKKTGSSASMGYGSFYNFRCKVAEIYDKQLGLNGLFQRFYAKQSEHMFSCEAWWVNYNIELNEMQEKYKLNPKILHFLYQSDCDGEISYGTCHILYDLLKDVKDDGIWGYEYAPLTIPLFAEMCREAWENKSKVVWC